MIFLFPCPLVERSALSYLYRGYQSWIKYIQQAMAN